jgi:LCP family protein required for cell wall assembly
VSSSSWLSFLRRFAIACVAVVVVTAVGVTAGNAYKRRKFEESTKVPIPEGVLTPVRQGQPANYLLIGSDERAVDESPAEAAAYGTAADTGGARSDVMMVLHIEPASHTGMLVSFPRDLVVQIPGHGTTLLNAAYAFGGPTLVIQTIEQNFQPLKINHYIEVNFRGFKSIVNAIGHVSIYFPTPVNDAYTGLHVAQSGCVSLNGDQALAYARSRHYSIPKDVRNPAPWTPVFNESTKSWSTPHGWIDDPLSDLDRIPRQQYFLRTISQAAINKTGSNPLKINDLMDAIFKNFSRDPKLKLDELSTLALTFRGLNPAKVDMITLPVVAGSGRWRYNVEVKNPEASRVLARLANFPPPVIPEPAPAEKVKVKVVNGSGEPGAAAAALDQFTKAGFVAAGPAEDAQRSDYETQVRYAPGKFLEGITAAHAAGTSNLVPAPSTKFTLGGDVLVIVGTDYARLKHGFDSVTHIPGAKTSTSTAPVGTPTTTAAATSTTSTTTTTVPRQSVDTRFVPVDPKTGGQLVGCPKK